MLEIGGVLMSGLGHHDPPSEVRSSGISFSSPLPRHWIPRKESASMIGLNRLTYFNIHYITPSRLDALPNGYTTVIQNSPT